MPLYISDYDENGIDRNAPDSPIAHEDGKSRFVPSSNPRKNIPLRSGSKKRTGVVSPASPYVVPITL
jgi:hypothetical protein